MNLTTPIKGAALVALALLLPCASSLGADSPAIHNMLIVGKNTVFLSHLPMLQQQGAKPMPHRYQAIFEVTFTAARFDPQLQYAKDREAHPGAKVYTLGPNEEFPLPSLKTGRISSFMGRVSRGHLEKLQTGEGEVTSGHVNVKRVVHFQEFDPKAKKPAELEYILFGRGQELFLAHRIVSAPDFDQILAVKIPDHQFSDEQLAGGVPVAIPGALNSAATRLKGKQKAVADIFRGGRGVATVHLNVGTELYFEDGELQIPPVFKQTPAERKAGFP